jgi:hypothetical protein
VPLANQGAPIGAPGPVAEMYLRVAPYCGWPAAGAVVAGDALVAGAEVAGAEVAGLGAAVVVCGAVVAAVVVIAGAVVAAGVVVVPEQAVMTMELTNRMINSIESFFILSSLN